MTCPSITVANGPSTARKTLRSRLNVQSSGLPSASKDAGGNIFMQSDCMLMSSDPGNTTPALKTSTSVVNCHVSSASSSTIGSTVVVVVVVVVVLVVVVVVVALVLLDSVSVLVMTSASTGWNCDTFTHSSSEVLTRSYSSRSSSFRSSVVSFAARSEAHLTCSITVAYRTIWKLTVHSRPSGVVLEVSVEVVRVVVVPEFVVPEVVDELDVKVVLESVVLVFDRVDVMLHVLVIVIEVSVVVVADTSETVEVVVFVDVTSRV